MMSSKNSNKFSNIYKEPQSHYTYFKYNKPEKDMSSKFTVGSVDESPLLHYSQENFNMDDLDEYDDSDMNDIHHNDDIFLYECSFCNSIQPCQHKMGHMPTSTSIDASVNSINHTHNHTHNATILEALQDYSKEEMNNKFIESNYKKWLMNLTTLK